MNEHLGRGPRRPIPRPIRDEKPANGECVTRKMTYEERLHYGPPHPRKATSDLIHIVLPKGVVQTNVRFR